MKKYFFLLSFVLALLLAGGITAVSQAQSPAQTAAAWLVETHQNGDGGYASFSSGAGAAPSDVGGTVDALLALGSAAADVSVPLDYLRQRPDDLVAYAAADGGSAGKLILALNAAGADPRDFAGVDFVAQLQDQLAPDGSYAVFNAFGQALAILGLSAAGEPVPDTAVAYLTALQATGGDLDGSWDDGFGTAGNVDATALALMALLAADVAADAPAVARAADFLARVQLPGGWEYAAGFGENANSTALAIQALRANGADAAQPLNALLGWQSDSGAFQADFGSGRFDDFYATVQALPAAAGWGLPFGAAPAAAPAAGSPPAGLMVGIVLAALLIFILFGFLISRRTRAPGSE
jgi:hypothetical protein